MNGQVDTIPNEYKNALLFAITPNSKCVGIKIFSNNEKSVENNNITLENYIDESIISAIELKSSIENGRCDIEQCDEIVLKTPTTFIDAESLIRSRTKDIEQAKLIETENHFIELGRTMVQSAENGKVNAMKCDICLAEMIVQSRNGLTSLMLKKNPEIVRGVSKMCRYANAAGVLRNGLARNANTTLNRFKTVMGFKNGSNEEFMRWFNASVELFNELTVNLSADEKRQLTIDPEISLTSQIQFGKL